MVATHRICEHRAASCAGTRTPTGKCCHSEKRRRVRTGEKLGQSHHLPTGAGIQCPDFSTTSGLGAPVLWVDKDQILGQLLCYLTLPQEAGHPVWLRDYGATGGQASGPGK